MDTPPRGSYFYIFLIVFLSCTVNTHGQQLAPQQVKALPECSLAKTNNTCRLTIDRANLLAPPTVQMYSNHRIVVVVMNPKGYERYFLDSQPGQGTLSPDVASSIAQALLPPLAKLGEFTALVYRAPGGPALVDPCAAAALTNVQAGQVQTAEQAFEKCLAQLAESAVEIYQELEPSLAPDSRTPAGVPEDADLASIQTAISDFLDAEAIVSSKMAAVLNNAGLKASTPDAPAMVRLTNLQKAADSVASDLMGYGQRLSDLRSYDNGSQDCSDVTPAEAPGNGTECVYMTSGQDDSKVYHGMVTRTVTYAVNALNLIANSRQAAPDTSKKKLLASVSLTFADEPPSERSLRSPFRWEASAGTFFSTLAIRSFSVAPIFTNGAITDKTVSQNILHPTVVPFAAANYRLSNDLKWTRWKSAVYWTAAVGINPNTVSADFATGISLSYRALMLSGLCHFGHDVRLTQGLQVGQSLGAGFGGSVSTQNYWTASFAFGVSVRVPALTGR